MSRVSTVTPLPPLHSPNCYAVQILSKYNKSSYINYLLIEWTTWQPPMSAYFTRSMHQLSRVRFVGPERGALITDISKLLKLLTTSRSR